MSPYEMDKYRNEFVKACTKLGWVKLEVEEYHERDWDCKWTETVWIKDKERLFAESDLTEGLVKEIIRFGTVIERVSNYIDRTFENFEGDKK